MLKAKLLVATVTAGMLVALVATPAQAWHPKGVIVKKVQNITSQSQLSDANTAATAVEVKPGDTIRYVITVSNIAEPASRQNNDMAFTKMTDSFPSGVQVVSGPSKVTEDLGLIVPKKSVTREYQLKVTSTTDGEIISNQACFTGDSLVKDNPQKGCDVALIKVKTPEIPPEVPEVPETPETPEVPEAPKTTETPTVIPKTGPEGMVIPGIGLTSLGYAGYAAIRSRRELIEKMLNRR